MFLFLAELRAPQTLRSYRIEFLTFLLADAPSEVLSAPSARTLSSALFEAQHEWGQLDGCWKVNESSDNTFNVRPVEISDTSKLRWIGLLETNQAHVHSGGQFQKNRTQTTSSVAEISSLRLLFRISSLYLSPAIAFCMSTMRTLVTSRYDKSLITRIWTGNRKEFWGLFLACHSKCSSIYRSLSIVFNSVCVSFMKIDTVGCTSSECTSRTFVRILALIFASVLPLAVCAKSAWAFWHSPSTEQRLQSSAHRSKEQKYKHFVLCSTCSWSILNHCSRREFFFTLVNGFSPEKTSESSKSRSETSLACSAHFRVAVCRVDS